MNFDFILEDRIAKIKSINEQFDLLNNSYISFSGGKDSTILHYLIDIALPNNSIPRIFANTGLEYKLVLDFVKNLSLVDNRIIILNQKMNIKDTLNTYGFPFKSKEFSLRVEYFNKGSNAPNILRFINCTNSIKGFNCPKSLLYIFKQRGVYNYSNKCCYKLKKDLIHKFVKGKYSVNITGMRSDEGGNRRNLTCITNNGHSFHPLVVCSEEWEDWFINKFNIRLCDLYYSPYNFKRTGCKGCPFNLNLQKDLDTLSIYLPNERKQCELIWKYVYDEYRRIGFRLDKNYDIFDFL